MKYISLFSGIGGFDLGFDRAGMKCVLQVEKDDKARAVLAHHWPDVPRMELVQDVTRDKIRELGIESIDLICGGFPCQDLSVAGQRKGLAGERSGLWFEFLRVIKELRPGWIVIENVPGLLSSDSGRDMGTILNGLGQCGYWWAYRILDAQFWGVPQRRRRVFIVASLRKFAPQEILFERDSSPWDTPPSREAGAELARDVAATIKGSSGERGFPLEWESGLVAYKRRDGFGWSQSENLSPTLEPEGGSHQGGPEKIPYIAHSIRPRSGMPQGWNSNLITNAFNGYTGGADDNDAQGNHQVVSLANGCLTPWDAESKRVHLDSGCSPTLAGSDGQGGQRFPNFATVSGVRRLTPLECERLQGFPDGWTDIGQSDSARYRQLGNAVCMPVAEWIGKRIKALQAAK